MRRLNTKNRERADEVTVWARFYAAARANFLLVFVLTILNMVLRLTGNGLYFPFSASLPTYFIDFAISLGGHPILLAIAVVLGAIPLVFYLIAFLFSKKMRLGWMIAGIVVSVLDTLVLVLGYVLSSVLIDLLFHLWIFGSQVLGLVAAIYLSHLAKALPPPDAPVLPDTQTEEAEGEMPNSPVLRPADMSVRARKLLSAELNGHQVLYRRVKRTNELVIDGNVYGEYVAFAEMPHELCAVVDGHVYAVGLIMGVATKSYLAVDGNVVMQKTRLI